MTTGNSPGAASGTGMIGLTNAWENYLACVLLHMLLPLLPIALEYIEVGKVTVDSITIAASMYSIGIGVSSKSPLVFGIAIFSSIVFAVAHGDAMVTLAAKPSTPPNGSMITASIVGIAMIFVIHAAERFRRHVQFGDRFFEFTG